jgi:multimeric flavodoxin WrbA
MKIAVLFASHATGGKHEEMKQMILSLPINHEYDFIEFSAVNMQPCLQCEDCTDSRTCEKDDFTKVLERLVRADLNLIVVPVYTPYPSKFVALMEKLLGASYLKSDKPLRNKKTAIVYYCSVKICDETPIKLLWQKYLMDDYRFDRPNYPFINNEENPNEKYHRDVTEYAKDILLTISSEE